MTSIAFVPEAAKAQISQLVGRFERDRRGRDGVASRDQIARGYVIPLFGALGWQTSGDRFLKHVSAPSGVPVDYAFELGGETTFHLAIYPASSSLASVTEARDALAFSYNSGVEWVAITNFSRLHIVNPRWQHHGDWLPLRSLESSEYVDRMRDLWLLSPDAIATGALSDQAAAERPRVPILLPVDQQLLRDIAGWRRELVEVTIQEDRGGASEVDAAAHRLLNQLIFVRCCEDRGIETPRLAVLAQSHTPDPFVSGLADLFGHYARFYDTSLFADDVVCQLSPAAVASIVRRLVGPEAWPVRYDFGTINVDVLGAMYEQYLAYLVEERKRESPPTLIPTVSQVTDVRKARGIYYTPRFLVDHVISRTVDQFVRTHPDDQHLPTVLDMSCGSGSFLVQAARRIASEHPGQSPGVWPTVLLSSIFGVDNDPLAVEASRLNLWLSALRTQDLLPALSDNVQCFDALASRDEWAERFPELFRAGGPDVIVGNPPFVRARRQTGREARSESFDAARGGYDLSSLFLERALQLVRPDGFIGLIMPNRLLRNQATQHLRDVIAKDHLLCELVDFTDQPVFPGIKSYACVVVLHRRPTARTFLFARLQSKAEYPGAQMQAIREERSLYQEDLVVDWTPMPRPSQPWNFVPRDESRIMAAVSEAGTRLADAGMKVFQGLQTGSNSVFIREGEPSSEGLRTRNARNEPTILERECLRPLLRSSEMFAFCLRPATAWLIFPYDQDGNLLTEENLQRFSGVWNYLSTYRQSLAERKGAEVWYAFGRTQAVSMVGHPKIVTPLYSDKARFGWDARGDRAFTSGASGGCGILVPDQYPALAVLALLNSRLMDWYFRRISTMLDAKYSSHEARFLRDLPLLLDSSLLQKLQRPAEEATTVNEAIGVLASAGERIPSYLLEQNDHIVTQIDTQIEDAYGLEPASRALVGNDVLSARPRGTWRSHR